MVIHYLNCPRPSPWYQIAPVLIKMAALIYVPVVGKGDNDYLLHHNTSGSKKEVGTIKDNRLDWALPSYGLN